MQPATVYFYRKEEIEEDKRLSDQSNACGELLVESDQEIFRGIET